MKANENLSIHMLPEKPETNLAGETPIYIRITIGGQRKELSLGARIKPSQWDYANERMLGTTMYPAGKVPIVKL